MIRVGICDDDAVFARNFQRELERSFPQYSGIGEPVQCIYYGNADEAINRFQEDDIHVYFLDIEYGDVLGMDVARRFGKLRQDVGVVYMTNYENYATKAFVCRPLGFVRKNFVKEDIRLVMVSIGEFLEREQRKFVFLDNAREVAVRLGMVKYVQMCNHVMSIVVLGKTMEIRDKLSRVEEALCEQGFIKINRSCLVNMKYIEEVRDVEIVLSDKELLYASKEKKKDIFLKWQYYEMNCGF